jgi:glutathione S-transferase
MVARLYWMAVSHPSQAARKMLELKGLEHRLVNVLPLSQRVHLRLAGFRGGTVPALKLDGRRVQGSRQIARFLDEVRPEPPLYPSDPELRARVEEAERWGEERLQPVPRRLARFGGLDHLEVRRWAAQGARVPFPELAIRTSRPLIAYYARTLEADGRRATEAEVRADMAAIPELLGHAERLLADGTLAMDPPNAATLQVLSSVRFLAAMADLQPLIGSSPAAQAARQLFPDYPEPIPPFLPAEWLEPISPAALRASERSQ